MSWSFPHGNQMPDLAPAECKSGNMMTKMCKQKKSISSAHMTKNFIDHMLTITY